MSARAGRAQFRPALSSDGHGRAGIATERGNEACACVGKAEPARLEYVTRQEETGQREAVGDIRGEGSSAEASRKNAGNANNLSRQGSPACRETARPDFGDT